MQPTGWPGSGPASVKRPAGLQVRAGGPEALCVVLCRLLLTHHAGRQRPPHLLELRPGRHLLREESGLDAVEQPLEPPHELGLGYPELSFARHRVVGKWQGQPLELVDQLRRKAVFEFLD